MLNWDEFNVEENAAPSDAASSVANHASEELASPEATTENADSGIENIESIESIENIESAAATSGASQEIQQSPDQLNAIEQAKAAIDSLDITAAKAELAGSAET